MSDSMVIRLRQDQKRFLREYAEKEGLIHRGEPNKSEVVRQLIDEKMHAQQAAEREKCLVPAQPQRESDLIKETFMLLNTGEKPWEVAEKIGNIELVDKCYRKMREWMQMERVEDAEKHELRVENECYSLLFFALSRKEWLPDEIRDLIISVIHQCLIDKTLPSEAIKNLFGVSLDEFVNTIDQEIEKKKKEEQATLQRIIEITLLRHYR